MAEENHIWKEFKNDGNEALSYIYHQNVDFLFSYGKKFTRDENIVLDTIQDLFYDLIRCRKNLGETDNIRFYLVKSFRRRLLNVMKNKQKKLLLAGEYKCEPLVTFPVEEEMIRDEEMSETLKLLRQGVNELNPRQREILYYKFTCDFGYDQICEIMPISYDSARQLVSRAISSLKKYLSREDAILMLIFNKLATNKK